MVIAGIVGHDGKVQTANLISSILSSKGKKVSVIDSKSISEMDFRTVRDYVYELDKNNVDILVLKINIDDVNNMIIDCLHFDFIIYTGKPDSLNERDSKNFSLLMKKIFSLLNEKGIAIINIDENDSKQFLEDLKFYTVTYGFNSKASITTSSVGDYMLGDSFICCLQNSIPARDGNLIAPHEYRINIETSGLDTHNVLAAVSFAIVNGVDLDGHGNFDAKKRI
ncbi:MAG TPA: glutamate ligase [Clostridiaceae bacterium]|nr:glutamate ligase [Clostridiaceae bacterium]